MQGFSVIIILVLAVGIFIVLREFFCWYFKINQRLDIERANNRLLKKLLDEQQLSNAKEAIPDEENP